MRFYVYTTERRTPEKVEKKSWEKSFRVRSKGVFSSHRQDAAINMGNDLLNPLGQGAKLWRTQDQGHVSLESAPPGRYQEVSPVATSPAYAFVGRSTMNPSVAERGQSQFPPQNAVKGRRILPPSFADTFPVAVAAEYTRSLAVPEVVDPVGVVMVGPHLGEADAAGGGRSGIGLAFQTQQDQIVLRASGHRDEGRDVAMSTRSTVTDEESNWSAELPSLGDR